MFLLRRRSVHDVCIGVVPVHLDFLAIEIAAVAPLHSGTVPTTPIDAHLAARPFGFKRHCRFLGRRPRAERRLRHVQLPGSVGRIVLLTRCTHRLPRTTTMPAASPCRHQRSHPVTHRILQCRRPDSRPAQRYRPRKPSTVDSRESSVDSRSRQSQSAVAVASRAPSADRRAPEPLTTTLAPSLPVAAL